MKLLKVILTIGLIVLTGCTKNQEEPPVTDNPEVTVSEIKVLSPTGAPALSLMGYLSDNEDANVTLVTGSETLGAELVKPDSEYDVILAPVNLGTKMIQAGKSEYRLAAIITWGNLYVVGTSQDALTTEGNFATFGEGSVVDFVLKQAINMDELVPSVSYYSSAVDVQGAFLAGNANVGMLAEPAVTATIKKAKEQNIELQVLLDLQAEYQTKTGSEIAGFPQAAIFVKSGSEDKASVVLESIESFVNEKVANDVSIVENYVNNIGADILGVPSAAMVKATWVKQNIRFTPASQATEELTTLLSLMGITYSEDMLSK